MGWFERLTNFDALDARYAAAPVSAAPAGGARYPVNALTINDLTDDIIDGFIRGGANASGQIVTARTVLRNPAVYRCVTVISNTIAALPLQLMRDGRSSGTREQAKDHSLYDLLARRPNNWQTAFTFKRLMQHRVLTMGNGYALPIESRGKIVELIPIDNGRVRVVQADDWAVEYLVRGKNGGERCYPSDKFFHVMGPSDDGLTGLALTQFAGDALGLALAAQRAAARIFSKGITAGGAIEAGGKLTPEMISNLRESLESEFTGADNAGKWFLFEEGMTAKPFGANSKDAQNIETRQHQIEEVARIFGVPRPFLMVDDTSWGSGIEQLGIFFVQYGLAPHFVAWEQAIERTLLTDADRRNGLYAKFNERALLRGSMKDQAEYFAKLLGSGGSPQVMEVNEIRELLELAPHDAGSGLAGRLGASPNVQL